MKEVAQAIVEVLARGERAALATVIRASGSTPQAEGARLLLRSDGRAIGTVGGGAIELAVLDALRECLREGKARVIERDLLRDLGMCCGGRMEVFVELIADVPRLVVFGAGHVAKPTASLARTVGFRVTVVDDREELNTEERFPECTRVIAEPSESLDGLALGADDWLLVMTHDHRLDEEALERCLRLPHRYLGMIGSVRKVIRIFERVAKRGELGALERVYAPVGLDIGAVSPEEIAVSIVAELVALRHGTSGAHMRATDHPSVAKLLASRIGERSTGEPR
jgi:xanthine dehydrogenase accessory factor